MGQRYSSTLSLTSALDGGGWSTPHPGRFTPGKDPVPIALEDGWVSEPVWMGTDNPAPTRIRSPDCPGRSESLYRLSCPAHLCIWTGFSTFVCICWCLYVIYVDGRSYNLCPGSSETECIAKRPGKSGQFCCRGNKYDNSPAATQVSSVQTCTGTCCNGSPLRNVRRFRGQFSLFRGRAKSEH